MGGKSGFMMDKRCPLSPLRHRSLPSRSRCLAPWGAISQVFSRIFTPIFLICLPDLLERRTDYLLAMLPGELHIDDIMYLVGPEGEVLPRMKIGLRGELVHEDTKGLPTMGTGEDLS